MELAVDTLKIYDRLRQEGAFDEKAARAVTGVFQEILDSELVRKGELRTESDKIHLEMEKMRTELIREIEQVRVELKRDIEQVRAELTQKIEQVRADLTRDIEQVRAELTQKIEQVRADLALEITQVRSEVENLRIQVKADIETAKFETIKWTIGLLLAQTGILIGAMKLLR